MLSSADEWASLSREAVYLNTAGRSPLPASTLRAGEVAMRRKAETPWDIGDTSADRDRIRELFAELLDDGVVAADVAVMPSCSYALSLAAQMLSPRLAGSRRAVLVLRDQNHSNVMAWQHLCATRGGELVIVSRPPDGDWAAAVVARVGVGDVAVCALPPCHWCDGSLVDLDPIAAACRTHGSALVVDATQYIGGSGKVPARRLGCAVVAASVHKWLLGPYGAALVYVDPAIYSSATPLEHHDRNRQGADVVECLPMSHDGYPSEFATGACRLDSGGRPSYIVMPMVRQSLELIVKLGVERIAATLAALTQRIAAEARKLGFEAPSRHSAGMVGLRPAPWMPSAEAIVYRLGRLQRPVLVAERFGFIRVSPYLFNTAEDVHALIAGLAAVIREGFDES